MNKNYRHRSRNFLSSSIQNSYETPGSAFQRDGCWDWEATKESRKSSDSYTFKDMLLLEADVEKMRLERDEARSKLTQAQEEIEMLRSQLNELLLGNAYEDAEQVVSELPFEIMAKAKCPENDREAKLEVKVEKPETIPLKKDHELDAELKAEKRKIKKLEALVTEQGAQIEIHQAVILNLYNMLKINADTAMENMKTASMKLAIVEGSPLSMDEEVKWETFDTETECGSTSCKQTKEVAAPSDVLMNAINMIPAEDFAELEELDMFGLGGN